MKDPVLVCGHELRVRGGQPGFVVIETKARDQRIAFVFDPAQVDDLLDEVQMLKRKAEGV